MDSTFESLFARYDAAMAGMAPVLIALRRLADIYATGAPVSTSLSVAIRIDLGRPLRMLSWFDPYHFCPAIWNLPPR